MVNPRRARRGIVLVDAIVGSILLGVALSVVIGLAGQALSAQSQGEDLQTAAMLLDEQLSQVVAYGPDNYGSQYPTEGECDPPFQRFHFDLNISGGNGGDPYHVTATVSWTSAGRSHSESVETYVAPRLGDDPDPDRRPTQPIDRMP
jgi:hypothetical protein